MSDKATPVEIESFNLADLDVSAMEVRLELTSIMSACPHVCFENTCPSHGCSAHCTTECTCFGVNYGGCPSLCPSLTPGCQVHS